MESSKNEAKKTLIKTIASVVLALILGIGLGYLIRGEVKKSPIIIEKVN